ncbi:MAG: hypothetical protein R3A45_07860 [Bdellovibrionota bacterium]
MMHKHCFFILTCLGYTFAFAQSMDALQANQPYTYQVLNDIMFTDRTCYEIQYDLDTYNQHNFPLRMSATLIPIHLSSVGNSILILQVCLSSLIILMILLST